MRIIAGILRGMTLAVPVGAKTRPTSDRTRGAVFSSLGSRVVGATVVDLFAGTGGLGLEAASRGAESVTFVENDRGAVEYLRRNVELARRWPGMECELKVVRSDVFVEVNRLAGPYNIILADPPYGELPQRVLNEIGLSKLLAAGGLLVLEAGKRDSLVVPAGWRMERDAVYGDTRVCFVGRVS